MREFIGVMSALNFNCELIKREALMFSRIAVPLADKIDLRRGDEDEINEFESLLEAGIAFIPSHIFNEETLLTNEEYRTNYRQLFQTADRASLLTRDNKRISYQGGITDELFAEDVAQFERTIKALELHILSGDYHSRAISVALRDEEGFDAIPLLLSRMNLTVNSATRSEVVNIVLGNLPVPSDSVSLEQIIECRSDPDSQSKFLALRHWMGEVARAELTPAEVEEKLEYLMDQYQKHMRLHRMKTNTGTLETVVTAGAEFLGDLVSFKWGKAAQALFSLKKRDVALLEGELTAPGKEVAYIVKARETFVSE